jgi:hypothetical protein
MRRDGPCEWCWLRGRAPLPPRSWLPRPWGWCCCSGPRASIVHLPTSTFHPSSVSSTRPRPRSRRRLRRPASTARSTQHARHTTRLSPHASRMHAQPRRVIVLCRVVAETWDMDMDMDLSWREAMGLHRIPLSASHPHHVPGCLRSRCPARRDWPVPNGDTHFLLVGPRRLLRRRLPTLRPHRRCTRARMRPGVRDSAAAAVLLVVVVGSVVSSRPAVSVGRACGAAGSCLCTLSPTQGRAARLTVRYASRHAPQCGERAASAVPCRAVQCSACGVVQLLQPRDATSTATATAADPPSPFPPPPAEVATLVALNRGRDAPP